MQEDTRCCNGYISTVASPLLATTCQLTTGKTSRRHLGRKRAKPSCTRQRGGMQLSVSCEVPIGRLTGCNSLIGIGEIVLLPLDVLKIKRQTNPEAFRGRGVFKIVRDEGFGLYRGWGWTAARNAPGSFALFGGSAFTKEYMFKLQDYNQATWFQNFVASIAGASASLVVSAPLDVIKTRIQNRNFENPESGFRILSKMARKEGFSSFFKGLVPKVRWRLKNCRNEPSSRLAGLC